MPWQEVVTMELRQQFVRDARRGPPEVASPRRRALARRALAGALHGRALLPAPRAGHRPPARPPAWTCRPTLPRAWITQEATNEGLGQRFCGTLSTPRIRQKRALEHP
jgi:hypothetical protein